MDEKRDDPRTTTHKYTKSCRTNFDKDKFEFRATKFLIDESYIGKPPNVQVGIDNLNDNIDESFLENEMKKYGSIFELKILRCPVNNKHLGLAALQFEDVASAQECILHANQRLLMGRQLEVFADCRFTQVYHRRDLKLNPPPQMSKPPRQQSSIHANLIVPLQQSVVTPTLAMTTTPPNLNSPSTLQVPTTHRTRLDDRIASMFKENSLFFKQFTPFNQPSFVNNKHQTTIIQNENHNSQLYQNHHHYNDQPSKSHSHNDDHNKHVPFDIQKPFSINKNKSPSSTNSRVQSPIKEEIKLTQEQIDREIIPHGYEEFYKDLKQNLIATTLKKLSQKIGYPCIEKTQSQHRAEVKKKECERDQEERERRIERQATERKYLSTNNVQQFSETRPVRNFKRGHAFARQETRQRVNRSSAYEPTKSQLSIDSEDEDVQSTTSSSSSSSSSSTSSSDSSSDSISSTSSRASSESSYTSSDYNLEDDLIEKKPSSKELHEQSHKTVKNKEVPEKELAEAAEALMALRTGADVDSNSGLPAGKTVKKENENLTKPQKGKKRKHIADEFSVAPECRDAKRKFVSDSSFRDLTTESADENRSFETRPDAFTFHPRSEHEKQKILENILDTLNQEDVIYLKQVHDKESKTLIGVAEDKKIPFGPVAVSLEVPSVDKVKGINEKHLEMKNPMIEVKKSAESNPKWWRGCSRCDVIDLKEGNNQLKQDMNYEDLAKAPLQSHVIQAVNSSSRRDLRGDQRRCAAVNAYVFATETNNKFFTSTLSMRAKNLRFSRSHIHKWGLFACEKIASGDAVVEYVGEKIRPTVADIRENKVYANLPTHDGSSYFFRVESDAVIDATLKGNKARFINHSCNPNCIAKVIKHDNGTNSIVIYAKQMIQENEEITYDYKFQREELPLDQKIHCNCRAPNCQKYLN